MLTKRLSEQGDLESGRQPSLLGYSSDQLALNNWSKRGRIWATTYQSSPLQPMIGYYKGGKRGKNHLNGNTDNYKIHRSVRTDSELNRIYKSYGEPISQR